MTTNISSVVPGGGANGPARNVYSCLGVPVAAVNDVQTITVDSCTHSTLTLSGFPGGVSYTAAQDVTTAALTTALNTLLGAASVTVTGTYSAGSGGTYIITATGGNYAGRPFPVLGVSAVFVGGSSPAVANVHTTPGVQATFGYNAPKGSLLVDETNAVLYQNTGTQKVPVWTPHGAASLPVALTYTASGTTALDASLGNFFTVTTATGNTSIAASNVPVAGTRVTLLIANDSGGARTITFTTNFKPAATIVGTASKSTSIQFISDGTNLYEVARAGAAGGTAGL